MSKYEQEQMRRVLVQLFYSIRMTSDEATKAHLLHVFDDLCLVSGLDAAETYNLFEV